MIKKFNDFKLDEEDVSWRAENGANTFTFEYPAKEGSLIQQFVSFVFNNPGKSVKDFYASINREYRPGNNSSFFAAINQSGIVELVSGKYYIGSNYGKWTQGLLKRDRTPRHNNQFRA